MGARGWIATAVIVLLVTGLAWWCIPIALDWPRPISESECAAIHAAEAVARARADVLDARLQRLRATLDAITPTRERCPHAFMHGGHALYGWNGSPSAAAIRQTLDTRICEGERTRGSIRSYLQELEATRSGDVELVLIATNDPSEDADRDDMLEMDTLVGRAYVLEDDAVVCVGAFPTLGTDGSAPPLIDADYGEGGEQGDRARAHMGALHRGAERDAFTHLFRVSP